MNQKTTQGFTLIELMVVVVIVAIFAAIAIPSYERYIARSYQAKAQAELLQLSERLENYRGRQLNYAGFVAPNETGTGIIYLPKDATADEYRYKIEILDLNTHRDLQQSVLGQGYKLIATPYQRGQRYLRQSPSYFLSSRSRKCASPELLNSTALDCGDNTQEW
jgi:type IV pilus assembly protein PilE